MVARQDLNKRHHGRRKLGSKVRKRRWAFRMKLKLRKRHSKRRRHKKLLF